MNDLRNLSFRCRANFAKGAKIKKIKIKKIPCFFAGLCYSLSMKEKLNHLIRKNVFRFSQVCKGRADWASRRNQIGRAKIFLFLWEKSLDFRDTLR
jgi:hypothetical protein